MGEDKIPVRGHKLLKTISDSYSFFFKGIISNKALPENMEKEELHLLIEERDFFSFKQRISKSEEQKEPQ